MKEIETERRIHCSFSVMGWKPFTISVLFFQFQKKQNTLHRIYLQLCYIRHTENSNEQSNLQYSIQYFV
jgi:hypothetical protein